MEQLVNAILELGSAALASEEAACAAFVAIRFPAGLFCPRCHRPCVRDGVRLTCAARRPHRSTLLHGTPFATKLKPNLRALLLAIRAFAATHRSISARELARDVGMNHVTLWRHLHTLRSLLPLRAIATVTAGAVRITGRSTTAPASWARVGARNAMHAVRGGAGPRTPGRRARIVGESVRTWLNGTFHGVSASFLHRYLQESASRAAHPPHILVDIALGSLLHPAAPRPFRDVRAPLLVERGLELTAARPT